jgi:peptidoglycan/xylan/chitin deacetylase (PgdA/CDA1 family)
VIRFIATLLLAIATAAFTPVLADEACPNPETALGVSRIVEIDAKSGPMFGALTRAEKEPRFLEPMEVVLTFDDGPLPRHTKPILEALDKFCTKATFFNVGEMAMAYPNMVKEVIGHGHTVGTHTWSHPNNLKRLTLKGAEDQIERGFAAAVLAAGGQPIAPFFRFPGLSDSGPLMQYLQERGIAAFTVDVVSNDSYIGSPQRLIQRTMAQIDAHKGGIVLFHDIKGATAKALPTILEKLKKGGYKVVHLRAKNAYTPLPELTAELEAIYSKTLEAKQTAKQGLVPFYHAIALSTLEGDSKPAVTDLAPVPRERTHEGGTHATASAPVTDDTVKADTPPSVTKHTSKRRYVRRPRKARSAGRTNSVPSLGAMVSGRY